MKKIAFFTGKKYSGDFKPGKIKGIQKPGDYVRVKFSIKNPNQSLDKGIFKITNANNT